MEVLCLEAIFVKSKQGLRVNKVQSTVWHPEDVGFLVCENNNQPGEAAVGCCTAPCTPPPVFVWHCIMEELFGFKLLTMKLQTCG